MKRILITGASGFLGQALIAKLDALGESNILGLSSRPSFDNRFKQCDVCDTAKFIASYEDFSPDVVFHLAANFSYDFKQAYAVNVESVRGLLEHIQKQQRKTRVILIGSAAEYGLVKPEENPILETQPLLPVSVYGLTKAWQSQLVPFYAAQGVDVLGARIFNLMGKAMPARLFVGKIQKQIQEIQSGMRSFIEVGSLDAIRDYIFLEEAVKVLLAIANKGNTGNIYHVASGKPISMRDLLENELRQYKLNFSNVKVTPAFSDRKGYDVPVIFADIQKMSALL